MVSDPSKLTPRVREIIADDRTEFFASRTSFWELSAKIAAGRLAMAGGTIRSLIDRVTQSSFTILDLEDRYILRTEKLPHHHSDPFDRILVAQALEEGLTILTSDAKMPLYEAPVIWR